MFNTKIYDVKPKAHPEAIVQGDKYRFTVLTDKLIRMEYSEEGYFEDRPTKLVLCREFPVPRFEVIDEADKLEIITESCHLFYDKKPFSGGGLYIYQNESIMHKSRGWFYGIDFTGLMGEAYKNLKGTVCTLDTVDGEIELEDGMLARSGFTTLDDSDTLILNERGWYETGVDGRIDIYYFGYINYCEECIRDFYKLTGKCPMIPRYALGNWWSRYYEYTEKTYNELMDNFEKRKIPLSVAVIDMDWHLVKIDKKYRQGWTGYTWNTELFPDPKAFLSGLHDRKLAVTLNLHPADGVRAFEKNYDKLAKAMGIDPESGLEVGFDASDEKAMTELFDHILHPLEDEGVDFWWMDWQQVGGCSRPGYDTLWMLNHTFYLDNMRRGTYPMAFSRYAGPGSHRYPIGFSGDTEMTWASLDFQPYFTSTASNIGYSWWSHDIGGHAHGIWDDDMQVRWTQYGVFSPIMRLHSGKNPFMLKEPWNFNLREEAVLIDFMILRHKLIPYLYTMNYRNAEHGIPLVEPMYYRHRGHADSRSFKNEYYFGTDFLVCPITSPTEKESRMGRVYSWLPKGTWIDIFSNRVYTGDRKLDLYRPLETYPVLVKTGAVIPMTDDKEACKNGVEMPGELNVNVYGGADGSFEMYEDNGLLFEKNRKAVTSFAFKWGKLCEFTIASVNGSVEILPKVRNYNIVFNAIGRANSVNVTVNGKTLKAKTSYDAEKRAYTVSVKGVRPTDEVKITFKCSGKLALADGIKESIELLTKFMCSNDLKVSICNILQSRRPIELMVSELTSIIDNKYISGSIIERLTAYIG